MVRRITILITALVLASVLYCKPGWCKSTRVDILNQLTQVSDNQLQDKISTSLSKSPEETKLLALDLIVYRWAAGTTGFVPDVRNINSIIKVLIRQIDDPNLSWASRTFPTGTKAVKSTDLPARDDPRVSQLNDLRSKFMTACDLRQSRPVEAAVAITEVLELTQKLKLELTDALALKELGDRYLYMDRFAEAERCYNTAAMLYFPYDCVESNAVLYDAYGLLNENRGQYLAAMKNYEMSAQQWMILAGQDTSGYRYRGMAGQQFMKAGEALIKHGDTDKALQMMTAYGLKELRTWAYSTHNFSKLIATLIRVAEIYRDKGDTTRALARLDQARKCAAEQGDPLLMAKTFDEIGKAYTAEGRTDDAIEANRKRLNVLKTASVKGDSAISKLEKYKNLDYQRRDELILSAERAAQAQQAMEQLNRAADLWSRLAAVCQRNALVEKRVDYLRSLAEVYDALQKPNESFTTRLDAAMTARKAKMMPLAAEIAREMIQVCIEIGDLQNALESFTDLGLIMEASGDEGGVAEVLKARGELLAKHAQYQDAIKNLQDSLTRYTCQVGDIWAAAEVSLKLASAQIAVKMDTEALETLRSALQQLESKYSAESLDTSTESDRGRIASDLYYNLACIELRLGNAMETEKLLKRAKRYSWLPEVISRMKTSPDPATKKFAEDLDLIGGAGNTNGSTTAGQSEITLASDWGTFYVVSCMLGTQHSASYDALPITPSSNIVRERNNLPSGAALVEYLFADSTAYVFVCSPEKALIKRLPTTSTDILAQVAALRAEINRCEDDLGSGIPLNWSSTTSDEIKALLSTLYDQLLAPIAGDIDNSPMWVFALPNELTGLPMHALINTANNHRFVIQDQMVSYLAKGMLRSLTDKTTVINPESDRLAIFADPENNLPGAQDEAKSIKAIYTNSQWYIGDRATVEAFSQECKKAAIIHIAAHHKLDPNPNKFMLMLAPSKDSDGSLGAKELLNMQYDHLKMVVLSACDSVASSDPLSMGPSRAVELSSLTSARSVLGGLWRVPDKTTSGLMTDFYRSLNRGNGKGKSLQNAQLAMIRSGEYTHPFYWACFALYGSPW